MAAPKAGKFLVGDAPTAADVCLVPQLYNARRFNVPLDAFPTLLRADENAAKLEPFAAAHPERHSNRSRSPRSKGRSATRNGRSASTSPPPIAWSRITAGTI